MSERGEEREYFHSGRFKQMVESIYLFSVYYGSALEQEQVGDYKEFVKSKSQVV